MTERESGDDGDYPDGSVGRYVREQWGATPRARGTRPYVAPVQEPEAAPSPDSSLPLRPAPERAPGDDGEDDVAAWAARGRAVTARSSPPPVLPLSLIHI